MSTITWKGSRRAIINTDDGDKADFLVLECARLGLRVEHCVYMGRNRVTIWEE
jgi:hypothetical protein